MSVAGVSLSSFIQESNVAPTIQTVIAINPVVAYVILNSAHISGTEYINWYILNIILGRIGNPTAIPKIPPINDAIAEYVIYLLAIWNLLYPQSL